MNHSRRLMFLVLISFYAAFAQKGKQPQEKWKEYAYPADGFAITAPADPNIHPDPVAPDVKVYRWDIASNVSVAIHTGTRPGCSNVLVEFKNSKSKRSPEVTQGSLRDISLNGHSGLEYESTPSAHKALERLYCVKEKAYSLTVWYPVNQTRPVAADRMFSSFRLLDGSSH